MTDNNTDITELVCGYLNELLAIDHKAISSLVDSRVPISDTTLLYHPTCQVTTDEGKEPMVGFLGVLNGIVLSASNGGNKCVAGEYDENNNLINFVIISI
jgi:hypothetical protein